MGCSAHLRLTLLVSVLAFLVAGVSAQTSMEEWRQTHFGTALNEGDAADEADPDQDGLRNLAEAKLGRSPTVSDAADVLVPIDMGVSHDRLKSLADVDLIPQLSLDLRHWRSGAEWIRTSVTADLGSLGRLHTHPVTQVTGPVFFRLFPVRPSQTKLTGALAAGGNAIEQMLARCQIPSGPPETHPFSGALSIYPDDDAAAEPWLDWYFCNLGLCGFVSSHPDLVKAYMNRYLDFVAVLNKTPGWNHRIQRVTLNPDRQTVKAYAEADSDDAYASTFVRLACLFRETYPSDPWFAAHVSDLKNLMYANVITQVKANGLVKAKQSGDPFGTGQALQDSKGFMMDNVENWAGLESLVEALMAIGDTPGEINYYTAWRDAILSAIHTQLWDATNEAWLASDANLTAGVSFYPELQCQYFPELYDMPHPSGPEETQRRYDQAWAWLNHQLPDWWTDVWAGNPFSALGLAVVATKRGEPDHARAYLNTTLQRWIPIGDDPRGTILSEMGYWKLLLEE